MNLALEQHISKIKSQLLLREMHESYLHSGYTRSAPHTNMDALYTAMMTATHPAHQHLPQLNMMPIIQQLILKSALLNQQQVASNHLMVGLVLFSLKQLPFPKGRNVLMRKRSSEICLFRRWPY